MEIIELNGYLEHDKLEIARRHIIPKQLKEHGLDPYAITFTDEAIMKVIREYTSEAGVRNLEREIASLCRKIAKEIVEKMEQVVRVSKSRLIQLAKMASRHNYNDVGRKEADASASLAGAHGGHPGAGRDDT